MRNRLFLAFLLGCLPMLAKAQTDTLIHSSQQLGEVVVTGTGTAHYLKDAPVQTEVITRSMLRNYSGRSISDILTALSPGFDISSSDMGGRITMGGLSNSYILILLNGRRLHGDLGGQNDLSLIDPLDIERIEIVRGASSSLYGSDAIAGVINVITRRKTKQIPLSIDNTTQVGAFGGLRQHNRLQLQLGQLHSDTKYSGARSDGWQNSTQEYYRNKLYENSTTKTESAFDNNRISQAFSYTPSAHWSIAADGMYYLKHIYHEPGLPRFRSYNLRYRDFSLGASAEYKQEGKFSLTFLADYSRHRYFYDYYDNYIDESFEHKIIDGKDTRVPKHTVYYPGSSSLESDQGQFNATLKTIIPFNEKHLFSAGVEYRLDDLYAPKRMVKAREANYTLSSYAQDEWNILPKLNLTAGARLVHHQAFGWHLTPKASLLYKRGDWRWRATYSWGFKTPTIKELYYFYERPIMSKVRLYIGNERLKPQRSQYASASVEYRHEGWQFSLTPSVNNVWDMIALVAVPIPPGYAGDEGNDYDGAMQYINMEQAFIGNLEFSAAYTSPRGFALGASYSYTLAQAHLVDEEASKNAQKPITEVRNIDGTANHHANLFAKWGHTWGKYSLGVGIYGKGQTERYYKEYGNAPGFFLWKLSTDHTIALSGGWHLEAALGIDNLLNHVERHPYGYNFGTTTPGRTLFLSLSFGYKTGKKSQKTKGNK